MIPPAGQDLAGVSRRVHHPGEGDDRAERVSVEVEMGDHPEVAATPAQRPEQVRVVVGGRHVDRPVGTDHRGRAQAVDGEPVLASHPALPASEGEATDARLRHHAAGHDEAERLRLAVDVGPHRAALHRGPSGHRVDGHRPHPREVDHDAAIDARQTSHGVPAAPHRDQQVPLTGEVDDVDHVGGAGRSNLERRAPAVHRVVDRVGVKTVVSRCEHIAAHLGTELVELVVLDLGLCAIKRGNNNCHRSGPSLPILAAATRPSAPLRLRVYTRGHPRRPGLLARRLRTHPYAAAAERYGRVCQARRRSIVVVAPGA